MGYLKLKKEINELKQSKDELFLALNEVGTAQAALYELWAQADLNCGPEDYDIIVTFYSNLFNIVESQKPQATEKSAIETCQTNLDNGLAYLINSLNKVQGD